MKTRTKDGTLLDLRTQLPLGPHLRRVRKLEVYMQSVVGETKRHITDREWEHHFKLHAKQGHYDHEPDFPQALREYQEAIRQTQEDPSQFYNPPPEFMPEARELNRLSTWREGRRYPAIENAWLWLAAMYYRMIKQEPGVSLAEWESLKAWYLANWQSLQKEARVQSLVRRDDHNLQELADRVEDDDGKSSETSQLIHQLRKLWACSYREVNS